MHQRTLERLRHDHRFLPDVSRAERATRRVVTITLVMAVIEVGAGLLFGSMALLADGWHMASHAAALGIAAAAYAFARRHADNPHFSFGTGKVSDLGGFASAMVLAVVALLMAVESLRRLASPVAIHFEQAIAVAVLGLAVNLLCTLILHRAGPEPHRHGGHAHGPDAHHHHHDRNLKGAYLHVVADALTSVLAIGALLLGRAVGWVALDPVMGVVGALIIARWSWGLLGETARVLLDRDVDPRLVAEVTHRIEADADNRVADIHVWRVGGRDLAVILSVVTHHPRPADHYKLLLEGIAGISHVTVEVNLCEAAPCPPATTGETSAAH